MKKIKYYFLGSFLLLTPSVFGASLLDTYHQAVLNDPVYKEARANWRAAEQALPIAFSSLLPQFDIQASAGKVHTRSNPSPAGRSFNNNQKGYSLSATQTLFNLAEWSRVSVAKVQVKQALAEFSSAYQDLIFRTAKAYFDVLAAYDDLRYLDSEKKAVYRQLMQIQERYNVGLAAIADVYDAKAKYEAILASRIASANALENRIEALREITGDIYPALVGIQGQLPLIKPKPFNIEAWADVARRQNYSLLSADYAAKASKESIAVARAGNLPTLNAEGGYAYTDNSNQAGLGRVKTKVSSIGLSVDFPIFQGGFVFANTKQANYFYQAADANREKVMRSIMGLTRRSYLGVVAGISQIKALRQSIRANESALKAARAAYLVGTRTIVDVLDAQTALYDAQRKYAASQYAYLLDTLRLKQAAGTLKLSDLEEISHWLKKPIDLPVNHLTPAKEKPEKQKQTVKAHYEIQLLSTTKKEKAQQFIHHFHLENKARIVSGEDKRYRIMYGRYEGYQAAKKALSSLPEKLQESKPWIKRITLTH